VKAIPSDEVEGNSRAVVVRYKRLHKDPCTLVADITAQMTEGDAEHILRSEVVVIAFHEQMSVADMQWRVEAEGARRGIACVAWIEEQDS
jgi:hypothetical protein